MSPLLRRSALALLCLGWLSACQILPTEITPPTTYALTLPAPAPVTAPALPAVRLGTTTVGAPWNGTALVYQLSDVRFSADAYHRLLSPASTLLNTMSISASWPHLSVTVWRVAATPTAPAG